MGDSRAGVTDVWEVGGDSGLASVVGTGPTTASTQAAWLELLGLEGGGEKGAGTLG